MFTTIDHVTKITGYEVTNADLLKAQAIIEVYIGRTENDIVNMKDKALLARATAYQSAYMQGNTERIFEQVMTAQQGQNDSLVTYKAGDMTAPWIAPLAVMACKKLSWYKSRSVSTGKMYQNSNAGYFNPDSETNWWND